MIKFSGIVAKLNARAKICFVRKVLIYRSRYSYCWGNRVLYGIDPIDREFEEFGKRGSDNELELYFPKKTSIAKQLVIAAKRISICLDSQSMMTLKFNSNTPRKQILWGFFYRAINISIPLLFFLFLPTNYNFLYCFYNYRFNCSRNKLKDGRSIWPKTFNRLTSALHVYKNIYRALTKVF